MARGVYSGVMRVGRATVFVVGLAVILALVFGVATTALGANGNPFLLGKGNLATAITKLTGNANGSAMQVTNSNAGANDTALDLRVQAGEAPMRVNSSTRVANLNVATAGRADSAASADTATSAQDANTLDNKDSADFLGKTEQAADADTLDGRDSTQFVKGFSGVVAVDPPGVAANSCTSSTVTVAGIDAGNMTFLTPTGNFSNINTLTLMTQRQINEDNRIYYTVCNVGNSFVDAPGGLWGYLVARQF